MPARVTLHVADVRDVAQIAIGPYHAILTDPPYGLGFMGHTWDASVPGADCWAALSECLLPGALVAACGSPRTGHHLAVALEAAGYELRDVLMWLYGTGFPKGSRLPEGYGTALKPAWEPIYLARWRLAATLAETWSRYGTGALNLRDTRLTPGAGDYEHSGGTGSQHMGRRTSLKGGWAHGLTAPPDPYGRWPANVLLDEDAAAELGELPANPARFFYTAKASAEEREAGCEHLPAMTPTELTGRAAGSAGLVHPDGQHNAYAGAGAGRTVVHNGHPCVKPVALARWLAALLLPPASQRPRRLLVPFAGSGSEMIGAVQAGWDEVVGIELDPRYARIAAARLVHCTGQPVTVHEGATTREVRDDLPLWAATDGVS